MAIDEVAARRIGTGILLAGLAAVLFAAALIGLPGLLRRSGPLHDPDAEPLPVTPRGDLSELERSTIELYRRVSPSVVHVANILLRRDEVTLNLEEIPRGSGSGFLWNEDGYVVTNAHVVQSGGRFAVSLADHSTWPARLVGAEPDFDVAVLKIDGAPPEKLVPVAIGTSADLLVGQSVFAIGNPFGLDQTLTTGIISGVGREIRSDVTGRRIVDMIQTDAAINPGNSGGPLLDSAGRLIGMNTAIVSPSGASSGVGFAVPVDTINRVVPILISGRRPPRAGLGVFLMDPRGFTPRVPGAVVKSVTPGSPADAAGLRPTRFDPRTGELVLGDVIVAVDDVEVESIFDLFDALDAHEVGEAVDLTIVRDGRRMKTTVTLAPIKR